MLHGDLDPLRPRRFLVEADRRERRNGKDHAGDHAVIGLPCVALAQVGGNHLTVEAGDGVNGRPPVAALSPPAWTAALLTLWRYSLTTTPQSPAATRPLARSRSSSSGT